MPRPEPPLQEHVILNPALPRTPAKVTTPAPPKPKGTEVKDGAREVVETVVFVVVLVLLLKTFLAEAFVIPTGSMATTLFGYHREKLCDQCGYRLRVNASEEAEKGANFRVPDGYCPNCRYKNVFLTKPGGGIP